MQGGEQMWIENLRSAFRSLRSTPGFSVTAILSLAIGIGGSVSMFTIVNSILLKPLEYPDPGRLVRVTNAYTRNDNLNGLLPLQFTRWRKQVRSLDSIAIVAPGVPANLTGTGRPEKLGIIRVSAEYFDTLRVQPHLGRWFRESEEQSGAPKVAILTDSLWRRAFSARPDIIGSTILIDDVPHEIVGVTPPGLRLFRKMQLHPRIGMPERADLFLPIRFTAREREGSFAPDYLGIARLKPGVTSQQAGAELDSTLPSIPEYRTAFSALKTRLDVQELQTVVVRDVRYALILLLLSVGLTLLIACANVANLSLVRASQRLREMAVRTALGASRGDLIRYSLTESFLIALTGTIVGVILSQWITEFAVSHAPLLPRREEIAIDHVVLGFAVGICVLTTILFGSLPSWRASRVDPLEALSSSGRGNTDSLRVGRVRAALIAAEVALGTVLVIGSGLLLMSFYQVMNRHRGFDGHDVVIVDLPLPSPKYRALEKQISFFRAVHDDIASIPGVIQVAANTWPPMIAEVMYPTLVEGSAKPLNEMPLTAWPNVTAEYFGAMRIPLRAGRLFRNDGEIENVAVVSESAARNIWPGEDPIGKRLNRSIGAPGDYSRVIGVVGDVLGGALDRPPTPTVYRPYTQRGGWGPSAVNLVVQAALAPGALATPIRAAVARVDPDVPIQVRPMAAIAAESVQARAFQMLVLSAFALVALLLAAIGIHGVVAYAVLLRRKEIGVRIALGADRQHISRMVFQNGLTPVIVGLPIGLLAAGLFVRLMSSLLFQVRALDPVTFIVAPLVLVLAAAAPCWLTARQAARIDPMDCLRLE
jgi:putative ABC transport system permease protein